MITSTSPTLHASNLSSPASPFLRWPQYEGAHKSSSGLPPTPRLQYSRRQSRPTTPVASSKVNANLRRASLDSDKIEIQGGTGHMVDAGARYSAPVAGNISSENPGQLGPQATTTNINTGQLDAHTALA